MSAIESLEYWAVVEWRSADSFDGLNSQFSEWRAVRNWFWGFAAATKSKKAGELADFLADLAIERGLLK